MHQRYASAFLVTVATLIGTSAHAHDALVPHSHPHGISAFAGLDVLAGLFALPIVAWLVYRYLRRS